LRVPIDCSPKWTRHCRTACRHAGGGRQIAKIDIRQDNRDACTCARGHREHRSVETAAQSWRFGSSSSELFAIWCVLKRVSATPVPGRPTCHRACAPRPGLSRTHHATREIHAQGADLLVIIGTLSLFPST
jgi:hypothetical protein